MRNHICTIAQIKPTSKAGYVITFGGVAPTDINGNEVKRIVLSPKQLSVVLQGVGVNSTRKQILNMSAILLRGARVELSIEDRKQGDEYANQEGKKKKYEKSHSAVSIDTVQLTASKEDRMLDLAMSTIQSSFEDSFEEDTFEEAEAPIAAMPE